MCRKRLPLLSCLFLALCVTVQGEIVPATAKVAVEKLAADLTAGKKINPVEAKAFAAKWNRVQDVMSVYKPAKKGQPSLEDRLLALSGKTTFTPEETSTLARIARLSRAQALVLPYYHEKTRDDLTRTMDWDRFTAEMSERSKGLLEAVKAGEDRRIARTATDLAATCTNCHGAVSLVGFARSKSSR